MAAKQDDTPETTDATIAGRMTLARIQTGTRLNPPKNVSRALMAELVGKVLGRDLDEKQWRRYENGEAEPKMDVIRAAAKVSGLSEAFMFAVKIPPRDIDGSLLRYLTPEEIDRAKKRVAEDSTQSDQASGKGSRKRPA